MIQIYFSYTLHSRICVKSMYKLCNKLWNFEPLWFCYFWMMKKQTQVANYFAVVPFVLHDTYCCIYGWKASVECVSCDDCALWSLQCGTQSHVLLFMGPFHGLAAAFSGKEAWGYTCDHEYLESGQNSPSRVFLETPRWKIVYAPSSLLWLNRVHWKPKWRIVVFHVVSN